jgi:diguanylate cyclase (GGDEF)-like protein/PAS domain S-box-containing protein
MPTGSIAEGHGLTPLPARNGRMPSLALRRGKASSRAWWLYIIIMTAGIPIYYFATTGIAERFVYDAYGLSSASMIVVGMRLNRPEKRGPWIAFAAGMAMFALGDIVFNIYSMLGANVPVPSIADLLYFAAYPVLAFGMLSLVHSRDPKSQLTSGLDGLIIALAVGALAWTFVLGLYARDEALSLAARFTEIAYPTLDLLLVAVIVRLIFSAGVRSLSYRLLFASVVTLLVTDTLSTLATIHNWFSFLHATPLDVGWLASYVLWGAAALHPSMSRVANPSRVDEVRHARAPLALLAIAAMTAPFVVIIRWLHGQTDDVGVLTIIAAVIFALIVGRLWLVTKYLDSANRLLGDGVARQTVFAIAAEAFVGAADFEAVAKAGVLAAVGLAHDAASWSTFVVESPSGPMVAAVAGRAPLRAGERSERTIAEMQRGSYAAAVMAASSDKNWDQSPPALFTGSVTVDNKIRGVLEVGVAAAGSHDLTSSLSLICVEMGLALKGVESTEERLSQRNERRFRSLVQKSTDLVTLVGSDGRILYESPCALEMLGRDPEKMVGQQLSMLVHAEDVADFLDQFATIQRDGEQSTIELEYRLEHEDGSWRVVDSFMTNLLDDPDVGAILLNSRDVTERRSLEQQIHYQAFHDALTGLANRALFLDRLSQALLRTLRQTDSVAVMFLDIDDFKTINDSLGHEAGDKVLVAVSERLALVMRPGDTLARLGGDEFAIMLDFVTLSESADAVANRILEALREPIQIGSQSVSIQASIGIALSGTPVEEPEVLLRNADLAMYTAKRNGKDRFEMFEQAMYNQAAYRYDVVNELRQAIAKEELEVFYQPIVTAHFARAEGVEALVRWNHKRFGMIPAIEFITVAESTQLIIPLGEWVLNQACTQAQAWRNAGVVDDAFYVSVNLSPRQVEEPNIVEKVSSALRVSGLPASALVLEITESFLMLDFDTGLARLNSLKALGLRLAIDDYGTGYSSLNRLADLPVDIVKIDKSFIDRLTVVGSGKALVQSVIDVTSALGMSCTAEGVEMKEQRALLDEMGCDSMQGYLFAMPMPAIEADLMLRILGMPQSTTA